MVRFSVILEIEVKGGRNRVTPHVKDRISASSASTTHSGSSFCPSSSLWARLTSFSRTGPWHEGTVNRPWATRPGAERGKGEDSLWPQPVTSQALASYVPVPAVSLVPRSRLYRLRIAHVIPFHSQSIPSGPAAAPFGRRPSPGGMEWNGMRLSERG